MVNGMEFSGFDELEEMIQKMDITEADEKKAMKKAIGPVASEVERNTPVKTTKLKKSIVKTVKKDGFATVGIIRMGAFYDFMQEFGTSQQKAHVGFFERSINKTQNEAIEILTKELLK